MKTDIMSLINPYNTFDPYIQTVVQNPEFHPKKTKLKGWQKEWKQNCFNKRRFKNKKK
jgi:hypothetical protein